MLDFSYQQGELHVEQCNLSQLANFYGTPCYIYSQATITRNYLAYANALGQHPGQICYAVKANSNLAILQLLAKLGAGFDIVSGGELARVLQAGGAPERIIFSGVGKTQSEMQQALTVGIACFNVESESELDALAKVAALMQTTANISIRVNPDVDANTHPYISTGLKENKFGIDINEAIAVYEKANNYAYINVVGVDCHIGSQLTQLSPFLDALDRVLALVDELQTRGVTVTHLDLGGGLGVTYRDEKPPAINNYIAAILGKLAASNLQLILEPGRSIVANAGILLTKVEYLKTSTHKNFAIVDAAMNDNIRPALYQAWQDIKPVKQTAENPTFWDIVGPVCETADFLAKDRQLALAQGDYLALMSSGAYGFTMSSNYNSRGRAAEVLVDRDEHFLVRKRETIDDLVRGEYLLPATALKG